MKNKLFCGDNLEFLKQYKKEYKEKVKLIYIDPPYNTKNTHFVYKDNVESEDWLKFMKERLELARDFLRDDGAIFISIDDRECAYLKILCDDIFGRINFVCTIPRKTRASKNDVPAGISQNFDWILVYRKSDKFIASIKIESKYYKTDDIEDAWRINPFTKQTSITERPNSNFTIVQMSKGISLLNNDNNGKPIDPIPEDAKAIFYVNKTRSWRVSKETFWNYYHNNQIILPNDYDFLKGNSLILRKFLQEDIEQKRIDTSDNPTKIKKNGYYELKYNKNSTIQNQIFTDNIYLNNSKELDTILDGKIFNFAKPIALIKKIVEISTKDDDIILDFFAGSGTTAQAVMEQNEEDGGNRQWILVQIPEKVAEKTEAFRLGYSTVYNICYDRIVKTCGYCFDEVFL